MKGRNGENSWKKTLAYDLKGQQGVFRGVDADTFGADNKPKIIKPKVPEKRRTKL